MRINTKPAAATAAVAFVLLLVLDLLWPGHGVWLLVVGLLTAISAGALWWYEREQQIAHEQQQPGPRPLSSVSAFGISGEGLQMRPQRSRAGVPLSLVLSPIAALAILLFVGGALGSGEPETEAQVVQLDEDVSVIDRSRDAETTALQVNPPASAQSYANTQTGALTPVRSTSDAASTETSAAQTEGQQAASAPLRPIVVSAPSTAAALEEEQEEPSAPESVRTIEYTVEEGDSLYEIALQYNVTVEAIMNLNDLDATTFIHPGDVLRIPVNDDEEEA